MWPEPDGQTVYKLRINWRQTQQQKRVSSLGFEVLVFIFFWLVGWFQGFLLLLFQVFFFKPATTLKHQGDNAVVLLWNSVYKFYPTVTYFFCVRCICEPIKKIIQVRLGRRKSDVKFCAFIEKTCLSPYWFSLAAILFLVIFTFSLVFYFHHLEQLRKSHRSAM